MALTDNLISYWELEEAGRSYAALSAPDDVFISGGWCSV